MDSSGKHFRRKDFGNNEASILKYALLATFDGRKNKGKAGLAPSPLPQELLNFQGDRQSRAVCREATRNKNGHAG
jgi:hypothetical protein